MTSGVGVGTVKGLNENSFSTLGGVQIDGFEELTLQLKKLGDSAKKRELNQLQRKVAKPLVIKAKIEAPEGETGKLVDSMGIVNGKSINYPNVLVVPRVKGNNKGFHGHLVHDGTSPRRKRKGRKSSTGIMPSNQFLLRAYSTMKSRLVADYKKEITNYVQRKINKLSTK